MPRKNDLLERIRIQSPCEADWDSMKGNERVRFCAHCAQSVNDLTSMTRAAALRLVAESNGRLCVRYIRLPDGTVRTADTSSLPPLYRITRRASRLAAGAFTAAIGLSASVVAQTQTRPQTQAQEQTVTSSGQESTAGQELRPATIQELPRREVTVTMGIVAFVEPLVPLVRAAYRDDLTTLTKLLSEGADPNALDRAVDSTALGQAVAHNNMEMVKTLLAAGADTKQENRAGRTALLMIDDGATPELVRTLLDAGSDMHLRDDDGNTALAVAAAASCSVEVLRELLDAGAKVDARNDEGRTPLMHAAEEGSFDCVKILVAAGANYNLKDNEGWTALGLARAGEHEEVVRFLVAHGALEGDAKREDSEESEEEESEEKEP